MASLGRDWTRPDSLPFPQTWRRFKGLKPLPGGKTPEFWIQDATDEMAEEVVEHMAEHFARDEQMAAAVGLVKMADAMAHFRRVMATVCKRRLTLVALTAGPDGRARLAGANVLYVTSAADPALQTEHVYFRRAQALVQHCLQSAHAQRFFGDEVFTTAVGLSVAPEFRGHNVGLELLKARLQLTKAAGLRLTVNIFTGPAAQKQAERAGYELVVAGAYKELRDPRCPREELYPAIAWPVFQLRARRLHDDDHWQ